MRRLKRGLCAALCLLLMLSIRTAGGEASGQEEIVLEDVQSDQTQTVRSNRAGVQGAVRSGDGTVTLDVLEDDPAGCVVVINNATDRTLRNVLLRETVSGAEKLIRFLPAAEVTQALWTAEAKSGEEMRFELTLPDGSTLCTRSIKAVSDETGTEQAGDTDILSVMDGQSFRMAENPQTYRTMMLMTGGLLVAMLLLWWIVSDIRERRKRRLRAKKKLEKRRQRQQSQKQQKKRG